MSWAGLLSSKLGFTNGPSVFHAKTSLVRGSPPLTIAWHFLMRSKNEQLEPEVLYPSSQSNPFKSGRSI